MSRSGTTGVGANIKRILLKPINHQYTAPNMGPRENDVGMTIILFKSQN